MCIFLVRSLPPQIKAFIRESIHLQVETKRGRVAMEYTGIELSTDFGMSHPTGKTKPSTRIAEPGFSQAEARRSNSQWTCEEGNAKIETKVIRDLDPTRTSNLHTQLRQNIKKSRFSKANLLTRGTAKKIQAPLHLHYLLNRGLSHKKNAIHEHDMGQSRTPIEAQTGFQTSSLNEASMIWLNLSKHKTKM
ncbi:LOW QUALITY PROTEIN: hypothetical protein V2J09_021296 [Rumex salicifolius]